MRTMFLLCFGIFFSSLSFGQIPNAGFENWVTDPDSNNNPVGWETTNSFPAVNVEPSVPGYQGNFAMKVKTINVGLPLPGIAIMQTAYSFSQTPKRFSAWVKSKIMPGDQALIIVALMKGDSVIASVDSCTFKINTTISTFTRLEFPIAVQSNLVPDSLFVMVASGLVNGQVGTEIIVDDIAFTGASATSAPGEKNLPADFLLAQNYPNPFNPSTRIEYALPAPSQVSIKIYNLLGQEMATLVDGPVGAGVQVTEWNASGVASGVYLYKFTATGMNGSGSFSAMKKLVFLK